MSPYIYKYIPSSMAAGAKRGATPKDQYRELFQETMNEQFFNASNWWTIMEETSIGSQEYESTDVRIAHVINAETGLKLGDDWKTLLFQSVNHPVELGKLYLMDGSTWLTINTEIDKNLTATCTIRRCNNTLRWIDEPTGAYYEEPCCIEYLVKEPRDYATQGSPFMTPGGFIHIEMQFNGRSNLIAENQRFLFGNPGHWTCYKVIGTGINDFKNTQTYDNNSAKILTLDLIANFVNDELDDLINGIADVYTNLYTISLNKTSSSGSPTSTVQLIPTVTYNGNTVERDVTWASSDTNVARVDSDGLVTLVNIGDAYITGNIFKNTTSASCLITVTNSPNPDSEIRISPDINYILEGQERDYTVYSYIDDAVTAETFNITCNRNSVPVENFLFQQTGNNAFSVLNVLRSDSSYLTIDLLSSGSISKSFNIYLRGAWKYD